jgi:hypothetical protein
VDKRKKHVAKINKFPNNYISFVLEKEKEELQVYIVTLNVM